MIKILFVCHGNICRSPMAEMILRKKLQESGNQDRFTVSSAAVSTEEIGNPIYPPARRVLEKHHVPLYPHAARQITKADYQHYDLIACMEQYHLRRAERITGGDPEKKLCLLGSFGGIGETEDPWYTGNFEKVYEQISLCCDKLLKKLTEQKKVEA